MSESLKHMKIQKDMWRDKYRKLKQEFNSQDSSRVENKRLNHPCKRCGHMFQPRRRCTKFCDNCKGKKK